MFFVPRLIFHFTIDTTLSVPVIVLNSADDTGVQGDNMTNSTQPTFALQHIDDDAVRGVKCGGDAAMLHA
ncbi:hypothetical protein GFK18_25255, partial [Salmonella enterica subsp. enterica serovar Enteritidis]|nr:hypothetical protein [Salmonella enterica subsp. enterica serovar Enteritidis]